MDKTAIQHTLNRIMEFELAGVVRYTHYALMVYGYNRIPIVEWLQAQATESLDHARHAVKAYEELLALAKDKNVRLEEYARDMIAAEMAHQDEVDKMLRKPGQTEAFSAP